MADTVREVADNAMDKSEEMGENYRENRQTLSKEDALKTVMNALDNPEDYDEALGVLAEAIRDKEGVGNTTDDGWYKKYTDLQDKYRKRFGEFIDERRRYDFRDEYDRETVRNVVDAGLRADEREERNYRVDELDMLFDGRTE